MPYIKETCIAGKTVEISKYHSQRWNRKGEKRKPATEMTTVGQEKINTRQASKKLRRLMNANFEDGDLYLTLDFRPQCRPSGSAAMQTMISKFIKAMRKAMEAAGNHTLLKYIYVKEIGPRGAAHAHMVISLREVELIRKCWPYGGIHVEPLNTDGQYADLAEYFIKYSDKTAATEGRLVGKRWQPFTWA